MIEEKELVMAIDEAKKALETVAFQMLSMNLPIDTITAATGLEKSRIEELSKKLSSLAGRTRKKF